MFSAWVEMVKTRLWIKALLPISVCVILVMTVSTVFNIRSQNRFGHNQLDVQNDSMARAVEGGMFDALAVGENDTVRKQFRRLNEQVKGLKVYVYDFNGNISFSTAEKKVGQNMDGVAGPAVLTDISSMLATGKGADDSIETSFEGVDYIVKSLPIANERRCFHCHGGSRKVLGGISVFSSMTEMEAAIARGRNTSILISISGLCLIILLVWLFFFFIVNKKVGRVLASASRLEKKDFSQDSSVPRGDEINRILNSINDVTVELRQVVVNIVQNSRNLAISSKDMSSIAETLDSSSTDASQKAAQVSAAAEQMSANNNAMADSMQDAASAMNTLAAAVEEMSSTVAEISKNAAGSKAVTDSIVLEFERILEGVRELELRADDVDQVTNEIRSISEQVSLLALNAKIEAARAGEAGKGFAVVAQEITELAADTGQSTAVADEKLVAIKTMVKDMIASVSGVSDSIRESEQAISGIAAAVEQQNATTHEIAKNINDINLSITSMTERVTQGAMAAGEIAQEITGVEAVSTQVKAESETLNRQAGDLARMADDFQAMMKQFKT